MFVAVPIFASPWTGTGKAHCGYHDPTPNPHLATQTPHHPPASIKGCSIASIKIIPLDLPRHNHHPEEQDGADEQEGKAGFPALADIVLLEPGEGVDGLAGEDLAGDVADAVVVDGALGAPEDDGGFDEAGEPEDEEDEGADYHDPWEESPLRH